MISEERKVAVFTITYLFLLFGIPFAISGYNWRATGEYIQIHDVHYRVVQYGNGIAYNSGNNDIFSLHTIAEKQGVLTRTVYICFPRRGCLVATGIASLTEQQIWGKYWQQFRSHTTQQQAKLGLLFFYKIFVT